ncbi:VOC family protein [Candidatus Poribacteria bacterium]|jgi:lactoylglutathione lyase|nr:VOC family protein [Candidatus Poribacteria bacterium]MBT5534676.1 VOC family protein [Candidatus Poribacteria bacterium]MBT5710945.1 VOC family protein [Candidatus Poribacteria bacterium]MBT7100052.1 VOC family protein [Candidatus Poribacteria bacterium]MBT7806728.1 VOC family protein [Candidatus Poribacteria bacterium]
MIAGLGHVAFRTADLERSLGFYCGQLGLTEAFRMHNDDGKLWIVYLRISDSDFIELFPIDEGDQAAPPQGVGYAHTCLRVDDLEATVREMEARGHEPSDTIRKGRSGCVQYWVTDPDGNRIELMQVLPDSLQATS